VNQGEIACFERTQLFVEIFFVHWNFLEHFNDIRESLRGVNMCQASKDIVGLRAICKPITNRADVGVFIPAGDHDLVHGFRACEGLLEAIAILKVVKKLVVVD
jgi:hypothetical protein